MTPRSEAIAFRIWQHCEPIGWDCSTRECAHAIGVHPMTVWNIAKSRNWLSRFRTTRSEHSYGHWRYEFSGGIPSMLSGAVPDVDGLDEVFK